MTRVAFYTVGDVSLPSTWFRIMQYRPALENAGIQADYFTLSPAKGAKLRHWGELFWQALTRLSQLAKSRRYDVLVIQKGLSSWRCRGLVDVLNMVKIPYLVDIDDAIFTRFPDQFRPHLRWLQDPDEPVKLFRSAHRVVAGNRFLADFAGRYAKNVSIIPTPIDTTVYQQLARPARDRAVIGWSGSASTNYYFNDLIPALNVLATKNDFQLLIISNNLDYIETDRLQGIPLEFVEWNKQTEVEDLRRIDIGLMPLRNNDWSRGKCGLKALQYMALGVPAVCSPVGINEEIVNDEVNGFLASTPEEWTHKLERLVRDVRLRHAMGQQARETVDERYSVDATAPQLIHVLEEAANNGKS